MDNRIWQCIVNRRVIVLFLPVLIMFLMTPKLPNLSLHKKTKHPPRAIIKEHPAAKKLDQQAPPQKTESPKIDILISSPFQPPSFAHFSFVLLAGLSFCSCLTIRPQSPRGPPTPSFP